MTHQPIRGRVSLTAVKGGTKSALSLSDMRVSSVWRKVSSYQGGGSQIWLTSISPSLSVSETFKLFEPQNYYCIWRLWLTMCLCMKCKCASVSPGMMHLDTRGRGDDDDLSSVLLISHWEASSESIESGRGLGRGRQVIIAPGADQDFWKLGEERIIVRW